VGEVKKHWKERLVQIPVALRLSWKCLLYIFFIVRRKLFIAPLLHTAREAFLDAMLTGFIPIIEKALQISIFSQRETYTALQSATIMALVGPFVAVPIVSNLPSAELECENCRHTQD
jgi:hypothetical protein